ncbi:MULTISPECIES: thioesterase family protein [Thermocrispum]|jgi:acyl-CoA thioester hydrolase|uniref:acyl-CoA thioesterase n=1 Tax=Thermocrispum TaxID=37924 RepID=UPI0004223545|nr:MULTISPECIES: thioesterase family protein [Thermocrispum]
MAKVITSMPLRVRYHECDAQGVVFNAHYLAYADMACMECIETLFGSYDELLGLGVDFVVAEANVRFRAPCHYKDQLRVDCFVDKLGTTSLILRFDMMRGDERVAEVTNRYVWVDPKELRPKRPPAEVRAVFEPFAPGASGEQPSGHTAADG